MGRAVGLSRWSRAAPRGRRLVQHEDREVPRRRAPRPRVDRARCACSRRELHVGARGSWLRRAAAVTARGSVGRRCLRGRLSGHARSRATSVRARRTAVRFRIPASGLAHGEERVGRDCDRLSESDRRRDARARAWWFDRRGGAANRWRRGECTWQRGPARHDLGWLRRDRRPRGRRHRMRPVASRRPRRNARHVRHDRPTAASTMTSRLLRIVGLAIAVLAVLVAVLPFRTTLPRHGNFVVSSPPIRSSCGPPITNAWHAERTRYLALSAPNPEAPHGVGCVKPARNRLAVSAGGFVLALLLAIVARLIDRPPGSDRRRRASPTD